MEKHEKTIGKRVDIDLIRKAGNRTKGLYLPAKGLKISIQSPRNETLVFEVMHVNEGKLRFSAELMIIEDGKRIKTTTYNQMSNRQ